MSRGLTDRPAELLGPGEEEEEEQEEEEQEEEEQEEEEDQWPGLPQQHVIHLGRRAGAT